MHRPYPVSSPHACRRQVPTRTLLQEVQVEFCSDMAIPGKSVLVQLGNNRRVVTFTVDPSSSQKVAATNAIRDAFSDVLQPDQEFFLQVKSEEWGGVFVDLLDEEIKDKSVLTVASKTPHTAMPRSEVGRLMLLQHLKLFLEYVHIYIILWLVQCALVGFDMHSFFLQLQAALQTPCVPQSTVSGGQNDRRSEKVCTLYRLLLGTYHGC